MFYKLVNYVKQTGYWGEEEVGEGSKDNVCLHKKNSNREQLVLYLQKNTQNTTTSGTYYEETWVVKRS
jgi:hypothetical protein